MKKAITSFFTPLAFGCAASAGTPAMDLSSAVAYCAGETHRHYDPDPIVRMAMQEFEAYYSKVNGVREFGGASAFLIFAPNLSCVDLAQPFEASALRCSRTIVERIFFSPSQDIAGARGGDFRSVEPRRPGGHRGSLAISMC